jgi:acyl carrier protein
MTLETVDPLAVRRNEIAEMAADLFCVSVEEVESAESFADDVDADSLMAIELLSQLEKRYDITIPETDVVRLVNLSATCELVAECAGR